MSGIGNHYQWSPQVTQALKEIEEERLRKQKEEEKKMITNENVLDLPKSLTLGRLSQLTIYRNYTFRYNLQHLGVGGKIWLLSVFDGDGDFLQSFSGECHIKVEKEAERFVDKIKKTEK